MITLAVLTVGLLGSCSKINERIDNLEKKVDGLENEKIASIQTQVEKINSSISDLGTIRSNIQSLTDEAKSQGQDITDLQAADKSLSKRIEELSKYVGDTLKAYATEEWARATFSTLKQYEKTCDTIAKIDARIGALDENLSKKIADCADSLTTWINGQFEGYYTAAEMDAKTDAMQAEIDSARAANLITDAKADSLAVELAKVQPAIDSAKAQLTREYTAAIDTAITALDGKLTKQIQDEIEKVNETVAALAQRVGILEFQVRDLLGRVGALEGMIQSVTILPAYSDGSVKVDDDTLFIECLVNPAKAVWGLTMKNFTVYLHEVATKAVSYREIKINDRRCFSSNPFSGTVSIKVPVKDYIPENTAGSSLVAALNVKYRHSGNLTSDYTTEFVPVKINPILYLPGVFTVGRGPDGLKDTDDDVKVRFSRGNLRAKKIGGQWEWGFYENQYDWNSLYSGANEDGYIATFTGDTEIDHFSWGYGPWSTTPFTDKYVTTHTNERENLSPEEDWGAAIDNKGTWRTLTSGEWSYLLSYNTTEAEEDNGIPPTEDSSATRYGLYAKCVTVMGKPNCLILYPDGYDRSKVVGEGDNESYNTKEKWRAAQAEGVVCLPAAGNQFGSEGCIYVTYTGIDGIYWSSSYGFSTDWENMAYIIDFSDESAKLMGDSFVLHTTGFSSMYLGNSVRLVTDVK